jgi:hypothetical protein
MTLPPFPGEPDDLWSQVVVEKSGLDDIQLSGAEEPMEEEQPGNNREVVVDDHD